MPILVPEDPSLFELEELGVRDGSSPVEDMAVDATRAVRKFKCKYDKRFDAAKWFVGYQSTYTNGNGGTSISRVIPQCHPHFDELVATKVVGIKGFKWTAALNPEAVSDVGGTLVKANDFMRAEFEVIYEHVPYSVLTDDNLEDFVADMTEEINGFEGFRFVEHPYGASQGGGEALSPPGNTLNFITDTNTVKGPVPGNTPVIAPQETFRIMWHRLPAEAWPHEYTAAGAFFQTTTLFDRIYRGIVGDAVGHGSVAAPFFGAINDSEFFSRPAGTVLLLSVTPHRRRSPTGVGYEWDLEYEFGYKPQGWLKLLYWPDGKYYFVGRGATYYNPATLPDGKALYNARPFGKLFTLSTV